MLGLLEVRRRKMTFALICAVVALISYLVLIINGLGQGLREEFGSALESFNADAIAYGDEAQVSVFRSELSQESVQSIEEAPGVQDTGALGYVGADYRDAEGGVQGASVLGYDPGTIGEPEVVSGRALASGDGNGLLVDRLFLADSGLSVGDTVTLIYQLREMEFVIAGEIDEGSLGFIPVAYMLRDSWQELKYGDNPESPAASIVLLKGDGLAGAIGPGFEVVSKSTAFDSIDGLSETSLTMSALRYFGYIIGATVVGVFFYVLTLQKVPNIGLLKALGASSGYIVRQTVLQAVVVALAGLLVSIPAAFLTNSLMGQGADAPPIAFTMETYITTGIALVVTTMLGVAFSVRSLVKVDPIIALAQQQ